MSGFLRPTNGPLTSDRLGRRRLDAGGLGRYASMVPSLLRMPRQLTRFCARLLLLALSAAALHGVHPSVRLELPIIHVERAHHFDAAPTPVPWSSGDACLACQLVRTPCGPVALECSALVVFDSGRGFAHLDWPLAAPLDSTPAPARAPPAFA